MKQQWKLCSIYAGWILLELVIVYCFFIETKGPTLEEIAKIFDGDEAETGIAELSEIRADMRGVSSSAVGSKQSRDTKSPMQHDERSLDFDSSSKMRGYPEWRRLGSDDF